MKALRPLLDYLAPLGVLPATQQDRRGAVEELLVRYRDYLLTERGLTAGTVRGYVDAVRPFVASRLRGDALDLDAVTAADVIVCTHGVSGPIGRVGDSAGPGTLHYAALMPAPISSANRQTGRAGGDEHDKRTDTPEHRTKGIVLAG